MNRIEIPEKLPKSVMSIGDNIASDTKIRASCFRCHKHVELDLDLMLEKFGSDYSLVNKPANCQVKGCGGKGLFEFEGWDGWQVMMTRDFVRRL